MGIIWVLSRPEKTLLSGLKVGSILVKTDRGRQFVDMIFGVVCIRLTSRCGIARQVKT